MDGGFVPAQSSVDVRPSNRHYVAIVAALLIGWVLWQNASIEDDWAKVQAEKSAADYADTARVESNIECAIAKIPPEECEKKAKESARPDQRHEYDLQAQRTMGAWTRAMGRTAALYEGKDESEDA